MGLTFSMYLQSPQRCNPNSIFAQALTDMLNMLVQALRDREVCVYSISCKSQNNIDITLDWLTKHAKS